MVEIVKKYLKRFPDLPSLTLAKKIYKENPEFSSLDNVRKAIRRLRGQSGEDSRKRKDKTFFKPEGSRNPFKLPESHADIYEAFSINQSKILILSDLHFPYQHNDAITLALEYGLQKEVNCILINGDLIDFATISRHEKNWRDRSVFEEFESVKMFLKTLRDTFPDAKIVYKLGNHDERFEKYLFLKAPEIFDCVEFKLEILLKLGELRIEIVKDKLPIHIGKLTVLHGHELVGGSGGVNPARGAFVKTLSNILIGHFHKTSNHVESTMHGDVISVHSQGCLCGMNPLYMPINKWNLGFSYVEHEIKTGQFIIHNLKIINGKVY